MPRSAGAGASRRSRSGEMKAKTQRRQVKDKNRMTSYTVGAEICFIIEFENIVDVFQFWFLLHIPVRYTHEGLVLYRRPVPSSKQTVSCHLVVLPSWSDCARRPIKTVSSPVPSC